MRIIARYIIAQVWTPSALAAVLVTFVVLGGGIRQSLGELLNRVPFVQISMMDILLIAVFSLPSALGYILPITFMFGIMFAFGRLAVSSELTAMRACGISLKQAVLPVLLFGVVVSGTCFFLQNSARPWAMSQLSRLLTSDLPLRMTVDLLPTGVMHQYGDWRVFLGDREADGTLRNLMLLQPQPGGGVDAFYADSAKVETGPDGSKIVMRAGHLIPASEGFEVRRMAFDSLTKTIPRANPRAPLSGRESMSAGALLDLQRSVNDEYEKTGSIVLLPELGKIHSDLSDRFSLPIMAFVLGLMAAPIGARTTRYGRSYAFSAGIAITVVYFVMRSMLEPFWMLPLPWALLIGQTPNLVFLVLGTGILLRVDRV